MSAAPLIVIFGAVVRVDGTPSAALLRRIGYGHEAAEAHPDAPVLCSGGVCRPGPSEASIMAQQLVARGLPAGRLVLDEDSLSTVANVAAAVRQVRSGGHPHVIACSDAYHLPRIRILLAWHGVRSRAWPGRERAPLGHGIGMALREGLAIPHNLAGLVASRARRSS